MSEIELRFNVPFALPEIRVMCGALTTLNRVFIQACARLGRKVPELYKSGVYYHHELGPERWWTIQDVLRHGWADCKSLAAYRAAELRERGIDATAVPIQKSAHLVHVVVRLPSGKCEDPSRVLGMGGSQDRSVRGEVWS